jgi:hypothetical protein
MPIVFLLFLDPLVIGTVLFLSVWLLTRRLKTRRRFWRFMLSSIVAFAVAPTSALFCGVYCIAPSSFISLMIFAPDPLRRSIGFMAGVVPLVVFSLALFSIWSYFAERIRHVA